MQETEELTPVPLEYVPAEHEEQIAGKVVALPVEYVPARQAMQVRTAVAPVPVL